MINPSDLDRMVESAIETALWSGTDFDGYTPLDELYDSDDVTDSCRAELIEDCRGFLETMHEEGLFEVLAGTDYLINNAKDLYGKLGHDFYLTRCGHGAGFWDRGLGGLGDRLTEISKTFGSFYLDFEESIM